MSMKDHSGDPKSPDSEKTQPSDLCVKGARNVKRRLCGIGTIEVLTAVLAFAALIHLWGYITSERALVFAENVTLPRGLKDVDPLVMQLEIKNGGKSPATIQSVAAAITHRLPPRPQYGGASKFAFPPAVPGAVVKRPLRFDVSGGYNTEMVERLKSGAVKLYLFGIIRYSDWVNFPTIFGFKETGFCFIYAASGSEDGFETCEEPAYTYAN